MVTQIRSAKTAGSCRSAVTCWRLIRTEGLEAVEANLEEWLREASDQGSGDDVTLALICRSDLAGGVG